MHNYIKLHNYAEFDKYILLFSIFRCELSLSKHIQTDRQNSEQDTYNIDGCSMTKMVYFNLKYSVVKFR